jgi:hypothetical protein
MKPPADKEMRVLIAKLRVICEETGDCPVAKARQPSQLDCFACFANDLDTIINELVELRNFKDQITQYGTKHTKLEAVYRPETLELLKKELAMVERKEDSVLDE